MAGHTYVSYCRQDVGYARRLVEHLTAAGLPVWVDQHVADGAVWQPTLEGPIWSAAVVLVVMSPDSQESGRVKGEILFAHSIGKPIIPLLLAGKAFFSQGSVGAVNVAGGRLPDDSVLERLGQLCDTPIQRDAAAEAPAGKRRLRVPVLAVAAIGIALVAALGVALVVSRPGSSGASTSPIGTAGPLPTLPGPDPTTSLPVDASASASASARPSTSGSRKPTTPPASPRGATGPAQPSDPTIVSLTAPKTTLIINDSDAAVVATVTISGPATTDIILTVSATGDDVVSVPGTVTVAAGATSGSFTINANHPSANPVTVTAHLNGQAGPALTLTVDAAT